MIAIEQYFHVVLFIMLCKVVLTLSLGRNPSVTIQMKAIEQYFHVVPFIMLYKVVLTFKSVDETLMCDHSFKWKLLSSTFMWYCLFLNIL